MQLELSSTEHRELTRALELHLERLQAEIVRTDEKHFREALKATFAVLEPIRRRLAARDSELEEFA